RSAGWGPPPQATPPGADPHAFPAATSAAAKLPGTACPFVQLIEMPVAPLKPKAESESLITVEYSPALAKRNDVPHEPRIVAPTVSSTSHVNASFGLLVPPLSAPFGLLY